jgi:hypothetical protein
MSSAASVESAILSNVEKERLLHELADELGYRVSKPTYFLITGRGDRQMTEAEWLEHKGTEVKAVSWRPVSELFPAGSNAADKSNTK